MGCLVEMIAEVFVEGFFELIGYCYIRLMTLIIPDKQITEKTKNRLKRCIKVFAAILGIALIVGLIFLIQDDLVIKNIGKYMILISLSIIGLQIFLGMIVKIITRVR